MPSLVVGSDKRDVVEGKRSAERLVRTSVVHVVALNALVHNAESAADHGCAGTGQVIGKTDTRTESRPVIRHQALRNSVLPGDTEAVHVELIPSGSDSGWCPGRAAAVRCDRVAADRAVAERELRWRI